MGCRVRKARCSPKKLPPLSPTNKEWERSSLSGWLVQMRRCSVHASQNRYSFYQVLLRGLYLELAGKRETLSISMIPHHPAVRNQSDHTCCKAHSWGKFLPSKSWVPTSRTEISGKALEGTEINKEQNTCHPLHRACVQSNASIMHVHDQMVEDGDLWGWRHHQVMEALDSGEMLSWTKHPYTVTNLWPTNIEINSFQSFLSHCFFFKGIAEEGDTPYRAEQSGE